MPATQEGGRCSFAESARSPSCLFVTATPPPGYTLRGSTLTVTAAQLSGPGLPHPLRGTVHLHMWPKQDMSPERSCRVAAGWEMKIREPLRSLASTSQASPTPKSPSYVY